MISILVRLALYALFLTGWFAAIGIGVQYQGSFVGALLFSLGFIAIGWVLGIVRAVVVIATAGLALVIYVVLWWALPGLYLFGLAHLLPNFLIVNGLKSALAAGTIFLLIDWITGIVFGRRKNSD